jgi:hypothetical protein
VRILVSICKSEDASLHEKESIKNTVV